MKQTKKTIDQLNNYSRSQNASSAANQLSRSRYLLMSSKGQMENAIEDFETLDPIYPGQNKSFENDFQYFEFELKKLDQTTEQLKLIVIRDVSSIIKNQQRLSDLMYRDAIEANYSHEQMTPLNSILANSKFALRRVIKMYKLLSELDPEFNEAHNQETLRLIQMIN
jgi:signal transduction histidine kinase